MVGMTNTKISDIIAWHGDPDLKAEVLFRLRAHRAEDSIVQGLYQEVNPDLASGYRGCAIGCMLPNLTGSKRDGWHAEVESRYGIPQRVARLLDWIFEALPTAGGVHATFAVEVVEVVPVGADLSLVTPRLMLDLLADPDHGVRRHTADGSRHRAAVDAVIELYRRLLDGAEVTAQEWAAAEHAAAAAAYAAHAAAYAAHAAAYAAHAAEAAAAAAYAAAEAAAAYAEAAISAARSEHWKWLGARLIHHLDAAA